MITLKNITEMLDKHNKKYEVLDETHVKLYDSKESKNFVTVAINKDDGGNTVSYAGKIIGDLADLECAI